MNELDQIAAQFGVSEPVFRIISNGGELEFGVKDRYVAPESDDPVFQAIRATYSEYLDVGRRSFTANVNLVGAYGRMLETIRTFVLNASPQKNPKQTALYKWLSCTRPEYHHPSSVGFLGIYRYIMNNDLENFRDKANPHGKNVLAVLELMRKKYEE